MLPVRYRRPALPEPHHAEVRRRVAPETNVTGRLRSNKVPHRLIQDIECRYVLCAECEGRFSVFEDEICRTIFLPIHERKQDRFRYGEPSGLFRSQSNAPTWLPRSILFERIARAASAARILFQHSLLDQILNAA